MVRKKLGEDWFKGREALSHNTFLNDPWWNKFIDKVGCYTRYKLEWSEKRKPIPEKERPSLKGNDDGWERECFDFLEPFYLAECIDDLQGGSKSRSFKNSGSQIDIQFSLSANKLNFWPSEYGAEDYIALCECKNLSSCSIGTIEKIIRDMWEREVELLKIHKNSSKAINILPILFFAEGDRPNLSDNLSPELVLFAKRCKIITRDDLKYYRNQVRVVGWKKTWDILAWESLNLSMPKDGSLIKEYPATKYALKGKEAITVVLPVLDALDLCHVSRASNKISTSETLYQRPLRKSRIAKIAVTLLDNERFETCFPNNIVGVLNTRFFANPSSEFYWKSDSDQENVDYCSGKILLPNTYGLISVIDGQHRLYSYLEEKLRNKPLEQLSKCFLTFTLLLNTNSRVEKIVFSSINTEAEEVNANLVDIILYQMNDVHTGRGFAASTIGNLCYNPVFSKKWSDPDIGFGFVSSGNPDIDGKQKSKIRIHDLVRPFEMSGLSNDGELGYLQVRSEGNPEVAAQIFLEYIMTIHESVKKKKIWNDHLKRRPGVRLMIYTLHQWLMKQTGNKYKFDKLAEKFSKKSLEISKFFKGYQGQAIPEEDIKKLAQSICK